MSIEQEFSALAGHLKDVAALIVSEQERIVVTQGIISRLENRLKDLRSNDAQLNNILAQKASEVASAKSVIDGAAEKAKEIVGSAQTEANGILNKAKSDAAQILKEAGAKSDDLIAKANNIALSFDPQISARKTELVTIIEHIEAAKASFDKLKQAAARFAAE